MSLALRPITIAAALKWCRATHRRLPKLQGGMWAVGVERDAALVGVAIVGRPTARLLDDGRRLQVLRVAVLAGDVSDGGGHKGANSMLYGGVARAARAIGCRDLFTYIHDDEPGTSLRAAGWILDEAFESDGGEWSRPSRPRAATVEAGDKRRWFAPWSAMLARPDVVKLTGT